MTKKPVASTSVLRSDIERHVREKVALASVIANDKAKIDQLNEQLRHTHDAHDLAMKQREEAEQENERLQAHAKSMTTALNFDIDVKAAEIAQLKEDVCLWHDRYMHLAKGIDELQAEVGRLHGVVADRCFEVVVLREDVKRLTAENARYAYACGQMSGILDGVYIAKGPQHVSAGAKSVGGTGEVRPGTVEVND
jgi:chromosome segregation ATPase